VTALDKTDIVFEDKNSWIEQNNIYFHNI